MKTLLDLKQEFKEKVNTSHIEYDWDGGHSYSYINHPIMNEGDEYDGVWSKEDYMEWEEFTNGWLSDNDDRPPCDIYIDHKTKTVHSGCGCHDNLHYHNDRKIWEDIISKLTHEFDRKGY